MREWKIGDKFRCNCGISLCNSGKVYVVAGLEDEWIREGEGGAFSVSSIEPIDAPKPCCTAKDATLLALADRCHGQSELLGRRAEKSDPVNRKTMPVGTGVLDYFPKALLAVAHCSYVGNEQHNPGTPLHWDRTKSTDEADALIRHFIERGTMDSDGIRHTTKVAWRALALLQKEIEAEEGK